MNEPRRFEIVLPAELRGRTRSVVPVPISPAKANRAWRLRGWWRTSADFHRGGPPGQTAILLRRFLEASDIDD